MLPDQFSEPTGASSHPQYLNKRIKILNMVDDPYPVESGTLGTIYHVGAGVINVNWDNGRKLGVIMDRDEYEIID